MTPASTEPQLLAPTAEGLAYFSVHNRAFMSKTCLLYLNSRLCLRKKWMDDEQKCIWYQYIIDHAATATEMCLLFQP